MGILNVTPDSFSDGGQLVGPDAAVEAGMRLVRDGADLLDVGGESTRPGARAVEEKEERARVLPVVSRLVQCVDVPVSIDTYKASVADAALAAGASMVNDVSGLRYDPELAGVVAARNAAIVLMHMRGRSREMYGQASYYDVVDEVRDELRESVAFASSAGISRDRILVDPGLGFAKEAFHSYEVLARLDEFDELGLPILVGPSRKSFLVGALEGKVPPAQRDWLTTTAVASAVLAGVHVVRVHAVAKMRQVVRVAEQIRRYHRANQGL
jgi:dihydropteroate synthase